MCESDVASKLSKTIHSHPLAGESVSKKSNHQSKSQERQANGLVRVKQKVDVVYVFISNLNGS